MFLKLHQNINWKPNLPLCLILQLLLREEEQSKVQAELDECKIRLDNLIKSVVDNEVTASVDASSSPRQSSSEGEEDNKATVSKVSNLSF